MTRSQLGVELSVAVACWGQNQGNQRSGAHFSEAKLFCLYSCMIAEAARNLYMFLNLRYKGQ